MVATKRGRKPVHLELSGGKSNRQRLWEAIRAQREHFTLRSIAGRIDEATAKTYLTSLVKGGYVQTLNAPGRAQEIHYGLVRDVGLDAPRLTRSGALVTQGLPQENMWRTMRIVGSDFNFHELAGLASTNTVTVSPTAARDYLSHLAKAGYIDVIVKGSGRGSGGVPTRFRFNPTRYSGPRPPMIQRTKSVYDPNLGRVVWQEEMNDDDL